MDDLGHSLVVQNDRFAFDIVFTTQLTVFHSRLLDCFCHWFNCTSYHWQVSVLMTSVWFVINVKTRRPSRLNLWYIPQKDIQVPLLCGYINLYFI